ncbi:hypothetical protein M407DRAFT_189009 [Tulasnella calospora MUT 4182]|uniref:BTB domain-containing protein n=1 Tax=Tulasnella calospora MUT 4182 TaxID=1051891 RepID=A0A0C3L491_9AGAM|nr:hypothetical protein M407DRAFT_189009 [Tulasnella calospora MUT 4182]
MLAAMLPHFAQALSSSSSRTEYPLPEDTSIFAVNGVIDYVYDGRFTPPTASTGEEAGVALGDLLNLLRLADTWEISDIKAQVVGCIHDLRLINQENCNDVLETAAACNSEELAHYCRELKELNNWECK